MSWPSDTYCIVPGLHTQTGGPAVSARKYLLASTSHRTKVEEKRENFSLRKLRKPGEREREKYFAHFF
jgi:hypothetical protein